MPHRPLAIPDAELRAFHAILHRYGQHSSAFTVTMNAYHADLGPVVRTVTVSSTTVGRYDAIHPKNGESWLAQFEADLVNGLYNRDPVDC